MKKLISYILFSSVFAFHSCDMLNQMPEIAVTNANVWTSEKDAMSVYYGMQFSLREQPKAATFWLFGELRAQGVGCGTWSGYKEFYSNELQSTVYKQLFSWSEYYKTIALANLIIDNIGETPMTESKREYMIGSAHFARAISYFHLLRNWGECPVIVSSDDIDNLVKESKQRVFEQIVEDATVARNLVKPWSEVSAQMGENVYSKQYASQGAADALLAHAYAWMAGITDNNEYAQHAVTHASYVIDSRQYDLLDDPEQFVVEGIPGNSKEGIFELEFTQYEHDGVSSMGFYLVGWPIVENVQMGANAVKNTSGYPIPNAMVDEMYDEPSDLRLNAYFYEFENMKLEPVSVTGDNAYCRKWRYPKYNSTSMSYLGHESNMPIFRLADIILLRAEMYNRLGQTGPAETDLNTVRDRAGLNAYSAAVSGDLKHAILKERRRELAFEGHYFYDLVRNDELRNTVPSFFEMTDQDVADGCYYMPVASGAFTKNPQMRQNIYWKRNGIK